MILDLTFLFFFLLFGGRVRWFKLVMAGYCKEFFSAEFNTVIIEKCKNTVVCSSCNFMLLFWTASGNICACVKLLVDGIFVMAKSCPEALSREIFWHTYSTTDVYFSLETLTKLCSILMQVRRSIWAVNFPSFGHSDEGYKASTKSFVVWCCCFDIQAVVDFWLIVHDLQRRLAFR